MRRQRPDPLSIAGAYWEDRLTADDRDAEKRKRDEAMDMEIRTFLREAGQSGLMRSSNVIARAH